MKVKVSKIYQAGIKKAAAALVSQPVYLGPPFQGHYVSLGQPEGAEKYTTMTFREVGLEKDGIFYLVIKKLMG